MRVSVAVWRRRSGSARGRGAVAVEAHILARHDFGDGRSRYEEMPSDHHDHLIDLQSGRVIEFRNEQIEKLQEFIAGELGYELVGHRLELYAVPRRGRNRSSEKSSEE